ncbi:MAG: ABC1 kinase family protein [Pseudobdellovibrio sp.]
MAENKKLSKLKTGLLSRTLSIAKLGVNAGLSYAATKMTNSSVDDYMNSQAVNLVRELGELKGSMMKAGQMLSVYGEHFLPEEANLILKSLQSDSTVVDWPVMKKQLDEELSDEVLSQLEINTTPIGSASMGQVYLAVHKNTREKIALKIQYPDVSKAIDSDVAALKRILSLSKILPAGIDTTLIFEEVKAMLRQELNYRHEAQMTERYFELIKDDTRFKVPRVFKEFSTERILATEYMEGLKADHNLIQSLSQERRNRLGENFLDLYFKELFNWHFIQTDPHLGNYKIEIDSYGNDKIVLLDFGAAKEYGTDFITAYKKMIKGAILNDSRLFTIGAEGLGFIVATDSKEYIETFKKFCDETVEPFWLPDDPRDTAKKISHDGVFDWKSTDLPKRVFKSAFQFKKFDLRTPPRELVFLDRKTAGVFMFLSALGCRFNGRALIKPYLDNFKV